MYKIKLASSGAVKEIKFKDQVLEGVSSANINITELGATIVITIAKAKASISTEDDYEKLLHIFDGDSQRSSAAPNQTDLLTKSVCEVTPHQKILKRVSAFIDEGAFGEDKVTINTDSHNGTVLVTIPDNNDLDQDLKDLTLLDSTVRVLPRQPDVQAETTTSTMTDDEIYEFLKKITTFARSMKSQK
jgi:hypothetical protein